ncbi:hypothetical protein [Fictibacillus sp. FJAT-27399]|uniref:hypothetical protein n=1 Tax=Fictibacillus sp. FJAT-27399 TaxID=1729689 RepID=UPI0007833FAF|nr:hypothetical protein [Fictibacillus sp. FJAT-27399]
MIDREKEFRNAFYYLKRWSKSPLTPSYTIGYSRGLSDKEPAQKCFDYILKLGKDSTISFEEKLNLLYEFLEKSNEEDKKRPLMGTDFYRNLQSYIRRSISSIEKGEPVQTRRR